MQGVSPKHKKSNFACMALQDLDTIFQYFPSLCPAQKDALRRMKELYEFWNARINLISRKDFDHFYERHVLHSLSPALILPLPSSVSVLDAGTGGGFPGIPLAILFPENHFHLVDSIGKKVSAINTIIRELSLTNVTTECNRVEDLRQTFDYVVSRAVAPLETMIRWTDKKINHYRNIRPFPGILYLKGGDMAEELQRLQWRYDLYALSERLPEPFFETKLLVHLYKRKVLK